jgi:hypothetical protein
MEFPRTQEAEAQADIPFSGFAAFVLIPSKQLSLRKACNTEVKA